MPAVSKEPSEHYILVRALGLERRFEDEFSNMCFAMGAQGLAETLSFMQKDLTYEPDIVIKEHLDLDVYFQRLPHAEDLLQLQAQFPDLRLLTSFEENKDWLTEWKKGFVPFLFSSPFWVIPSWLVPPPEATADTAFHIYIEPGMAFGTGTHETTRLAAKLLIEVLHAQSRTEVSAKTLLDVGTGTAILALVAHRLGIGRVVGVDIDPEARRTACENLLRNSAQAVQITNCDLAEMTESFDLVVANIIDGVLTSLRHHLRRVLKPGGLMILSGILAEREREFYQSFATDTGLKVVRTLKDGDWVAALVTTADSY